MNKAEFLKQLRAALTPLMEQEREDALAYYDEWIEDRMQDRQCGEEEAIASLGSAEAIATGILENSSSSAKSTPARDRVDEGWSTLNAGGADVRHMLIRTKNTKLSIKPSQGNEVKLRYNEDEYHSYDCVLENGRLTLELRPQTRFFFGIGFFFSPSYSIELSVPRDFAAAIDAQSSNAAMKMDDIALWGTLRLHTSNAQIQAGHLDAKEIDIRSSNAALLADELRASGAITLRTSNSRIEASHISCEGALHLQTSNGRVQADSLSCKDTLRIQSSNGALHISKLYSNNIILTTSNSSISGILPGRAEEYTVQSTTSNAKNSLKEHCFKGEKQVEARTSNSGIKLEFEG